MIIELEMIEAAKDFVHEIDRATIDLVRRKLRVRYTWAVEILKALEARGIVGRTNGSLARVVYY